MKQQFVITKNVQRTYQLADKLMEKGNGTPGLGLLYGTPGLGKTEAAIHMHVQRNYIYLRSKTAWTIRWFLNDLLHELNEKEESRTKRAYDRLVEVLTIEPKLVIIDEVDHMLHDSKVIETMRDLHDETGNCFLLIGMQDAERKLKGFPHLYSRFADVVKVQPIDPAEILAISDKLSDVPMSETAAERLFEVTKGEFRNIITWLYSLERKAKANSMEVIDPKMIKNRK